MAQDTVSTTLECARCKNTRTAVNFISTQDITKPTYTRLRCRVSGSVKVRKNHLVKLVGKDGDEEKRDHELRENRDKQTRSGVLRSRAVLD